MTRTARDIQALVLRIQREFLNTPALKLTSPQAERRFGIDPITCGAVLDVLVDAHVLSRNSEGAYARFFPRLASAA